MSLYHSSWDPVNDIHLLHDCKKTCSYIGRIHCCWNLVYGAIVYACPMNVCCSIRKRTDQLPGPFEEKERSHCLPEQYKRSHVSLFLYLPISTLPVTNNGPSNPGIQCFTFTFVHCWRISNGMHFSDSIRLALTIILERKVMWNSCQGTGRDFSGTTTRRWSIGCHCWSMLSSRCDCC